MKAMVYHGNRDVRLRDVEEPQPGPGEAKLRIDYCGICATDIEEYIYGPAFISHDEPNPLTGRKIPITIGHELTGTVVEAGEGVRNVRPGDRAVINGVLTCGSCCWCLRGETGQCPLMTAVGFGADGGLAEYIVWPASHVIALPASVSSREAGLVEPAAVGHHAVMRGRVGPGEAVAVVGVGPVGMLAMQAARTMGARVFAVDRRPVSLDLAVDLGRRWGCQRGRRGPGRGAAPPHGRNGAGRGDRCRRRTRNYATVGRVGQKRGQGGTGWRFTRPKPGVRLRARRRQGGRGRRHPRLPPEAT